MLKLKKMTKKIIHDPVWSNLSVNIIIVMVAYLFLRLTSGQEGHNITGTLKAGATLQPFQTENGHIVIYMVMGSLMLVFLVFLIRLIKGMRDKYQIARSK